MRRFCQKRNAGYVNGAFLDFSAKKIGLRRPWNIHWHRNWNPNHDLPPAEFSDPSHWMCRFKDY
jgi:hypothetical protein